MPFWRGWHLPGQIWDNLAAWQDKVGWDKHSVIAQPLFVGEAQHDFRPRRARPRSTSSATHARVV